MITVVLIPSLPLLVVGPKVWTFRDLTTCEHLFATLQGYPNRALPPHARHGNATIALAAAADLERVDGLTDALELCLLSVESQPEKFGRAALRWHDLVGARTG
jgi:hypothetical protein